MCLLNQLNARSFLNLLLFFIIFNKVCFTGSKYSNRYKIYNSILLRKKFFHIYNPSKDKKILKKVWEECKITTKIEEEGGGLESWSLSHVLLSVIVFTLELTEVNMTCIRSTHPVTESGGFMEPCHFLRIYTASDA